MDSPPAFGQNAAQYSYVHNEIMAPTLLLRRLTAALLCCAAMTAGARAESITVAAAADLKFALEEVATAFRAAHPNDKVEVIYGSSGKFHTQIQNGAPFDLFFSADIAYPRELQQKRLTAGEPTLYAIGRIVLWSRDARLAKLPLQDVGAEKAIRKFAIANPQHAPYGRRAMEALKQQGAWPAIEPRLVLGENIAHTAQFVDTGAAEAGIIALSLALSPTMAERGTWTLIPAEWHEPLEQAFVVTRRGAGKPLAENFARYVASPPARVILRRYGFVLPGEQ